LSPQALGFEYFNLEPRCTGPAPQLSSTICVYESELAVRGAVSYFADSSSNLRMFCLVISQILTSGALLHLAKSLLQIRTAAGHHPSFAGVRLRTPAHFLQGLVVLSRWKDLKLQSAGRRTRQHPFQRLGDPSRLPQVLHRMRAEDAENARFCSQSGAYA